MATKPKAVPGVNLAALDAIQDANARDVLKQLVDGWQVRNAAAGNGDQRFVSYDELRQMGLVPGGVANNKLAPSQPGGPGSTGGGDGFVNGADIERVIRDVQSSVIESPLFKELGENIQLIDGRITLEQLARIAAVEQVAAGVAKNAADITKTANDLVAEANARLGTDQVQGSKISTLEVTTADQASKISNLTSRVGSSESSITNLQNTTTAQATAISTLNSRVGTAESSITNLQSTTSSQATNLNALTTRVGSAESKITSLQTTTASQATSLSQLTTKVDDADSKITDLQTTTSDQATQLSSLTSRTTTAESKISTLETTTANEATKLTAVISTVGQKNKIFVQTTPPQGSPSYALVVNDIWLDSDNGNKLYRWTGTTWVESSDTRIANSAALITSETTTRTSSDNALARAVNQLWATVGNSNSLVNSGSEVTSNPGAGTATNWTQVQTALKDPVTGDYISSAAVRTDASTAISKAGNLEAKYTVKVDVNGYVSGFGLASTANNSTPFSDFIVRADRFAIGQPRSSAGITFTPEVPFVVLTSTDTNGNEPGVYIDKAMIKNADISSAKIADAAITSAKIASAAIGTAKIEDAAITKLKLSPSAFTTGSVYVPNNSPATFAHGAGHTPILTLWSADGTPNIISANSSTVTVRLDFSGGGTIYYSYL